MAPILKQINFVVRDMDAAVAFYRRLGLDIKASPGAWGQHHISHNPEEGADIDFDSEWSLGVWNAGAKKAGTNGANVIGFEVATREAVDELYAHMVDGGYPGLQPPYDANWGVRFAVVEDPDGNSIGISSPVDPATRKPWPDPPA